MSDGSVDAMAAYGQQLLASTPEESKGKPCTELCVFRLLPKFAADHDKALSIFESEIGKNCAPGQPWSKGIGRVGWGFALDDPDVFLYLVDWERIEDHWAFWLDQGFPPVMAAISKLFEAGRPLVRHFKFPIKGSLPAELPYVRVAIWDDGEVFNGNVSKHNNTALGDEKNLREGYAIDVNETSWWASMMGFKSEAEAIETKFNTGEGAVSHIFYVKYVDERF